MVSASLEAAGSPRPRSIAQLLDVAAQSIVRAYRPILVSGMALFWFPQILAVAVQTPTFKVLDIAVLVVQAVLSGLATAAIVTAVSAPADRPATIRAALANTWRNTKPVVALNLLFYAVWMIGLVVLGTPLFVWTIVARHADTGFLKIASLVLCIVPAAAIELILFSYSLLAYNVAVDAVIREGMTAKAARKTALQRLFEKRERKRSLALGLCAVAPLAFQNAIAYGFYQSRVPWPPLASACVTSFVYILASAFGIALAVAYDDDLRVRFEATDLTIVADALA